MNHADDKLLDHNYDGIQELDNNLPPWWLNLFYITIIFALAYTLYYHVFDAGYSQSQQYEKEMNPDYVKPEKTAMSIPGYTGPYYTGKSEETPISLLGNTLMAAPLSRPAADKKPEAAAITALSDPAALASGKQIFVTNCVACHGVNGEGTIGPNMTDNYWINGQGDIASIVEVITNGRIAKGMIPWNATLTPEQILEVGSYILTLQGSNPPNAKAPQGTKVE